MKLYTHTITVVQTKTYVLEFQSTSEEIDAMSYGRELMSEIDKGDNEYFVKEHMTWDHCCEESQDEER